MRGPSARSGTADHRLAGLALYTIADVEAFAADVADARRRWLAARRVAPMVLYWWHDRQAGQLRFSLVSAAHGRLPFACRVPPAADFRTIARAWLTSPYLDGIPWSETGPVSADAAEGDAEPASLAVWSLRLP